MKDYTFVITTVGSMEEGEKIAKALVEERLAACCNILPEIRSIYTWKDKICDEREVMLFVKSKTLHINDLIERIKDLHSYEVPEIIALPIERGLRQYFTWIDEVVK